MGMSAFDIAAVLTLNSAQFDAGLRKAKGEAVGFGTTSKKTFGGVLKAFGALGVGVAAFAGLSLKTGAEFDKSMSQVAATLGKTMDEMEDTVGAVDTQYGHFSGTLREFAMFMGKNTAFSATQASEALNYMALAGYDAQKSMNMLPSVLNLAAAGNMELGTASDMVTDAQSALGLSLKETTKMVDQMAKASSRSNTSVEQLGSAFLTVGGTAKILKGGTKELSTALGLLADNGIKGAEGGTALRNILNSISGKKFEKNFGAMGISAYDAEGNMRNLKDVFIDMNKAMDGMSSQEKTKLIASTFNIRDLKSVNALLGTGAERWDELTAAIEDSEGAAGKMADTQLDNLAGDITLMKSAFEGLQISISDKLAPSFRGVVQLVTDGIGSMTDIMQGEGVTGITSFASAMIDAMVNQIPNALVSLGDMGSNMVDFAVNVMDGLSQGLVSGVPTLIGQVMPILAGLSEGLRANAGTLIDSGINLILNLAQGLIDSMPILISYMPTIVTNIAGIINDNAPKLIVAGFQLIVMLAKGIIDNIPVIIKNLPQIFTAILAAFTAFNWAAVGKIAVKGIGNGIKALGKGLASAAKSVAKSGIKAFTQGFSNARSVGANAVRALAQAIAKGLGAVRTAAIKVAKGAINAIKGAFSNVSEIGMNLVRGIWSGISGGLGWIKSQIRGWVGNVKNFLKSLFGIHSPSTWARDVIGMNIVRGLAEGLEDGTGLIDDTMSELVNVPDVEIGTPSGGLMESLKQVSVVNNITVDGAENPEEFANRLVRQLQIDMRTA